MVEVGLLGWATGGGRLTEGYRYLHESTNLKSGSRTFVYAIRTVPQRHAALYLPAAARTTSSTAVGGCIFCTALFCRDLSRDS